MKREADTNFDFLFRWSQTVVNLKESGEMLPGDVLLVTAFISYVGCFTRRYRLLLMEEDWVPTLQKTDVSFTIYQDGIKF